VNDGIVENSGPREHQMWAPGRPTPAPTTLSARAGSVDASAQAREAT
jgi:hypothetical protein